MGILTAFINTATQLFIANKYRSVILINELKNFLQKSNQQLEPQLIKRINTYTVQSAITNLWFSTLRGYKINKNEMLGGLYVGASTPVYDDLMDTHHFTHQQLKNRVDNLTADDDASFMLLNYLRRRTDDTVKHADICQYYLNKLGEAQTQSIRQHSENKLTTEEIRQITYDKGGYATLLYRSLLSNKLKDGEEEAIYYLGALLQLINDVFDIYKDHTNHSQTLATAATDIHLLTEEFLSLKNKVISLFLKSDYKTANIRRMLYQCFTVISRGKVCLDQLQALQQKNKPFDVADFTRKQLICDMDTFASLWNSYKICRRWKKEITG